MIAQLDIEVSPAIQEAALHAIEGLGFKVTKVTTQSSAYLVLVGGRETDIRIIGHTKGIKDVHRVSDVYKLVSRKWKVGRTKINLGDGVEIGGGAFQLIAGPCSVEDQEILTSIASFLNSQDIKIMRGGAFKPRTSPYSFRGHGIEGLKLFSEVARAHKLKVISEVLDPSQIESMYPYIDIYQVGARNSQNFMLLHELGKVDKPVLIKRGMSGTIEELLQSAEYVFASGNEKLILCERGIRTYEKAYRNTLDINAIPILKEKSHLPIVVDPSHGIGIRQYVESVALAAVVAGADGLMIETHECPEKALSDGDQTLDFAEMRVLAEKVQKLIHIV